MRFLAFVGSLCCKPCGVVSCVWSLPALTHLLKDLTIEVGQVANIVLAGFLRRSLEARRSNARRDCACGYQRYCRRGHSRIVFGTGCTVLYEAGSFALVQSASVFDHLLLYLSRWGADYRFCRCSGLFSLDRRPASRFASYRTVMYDYIVFCVCSGHFRCFQLSASCVMLITCHASSW